MKKKYTKPEQFEILKQSKEAKKLLEKKFKEVMKFLRETPFETIALNENFKPTENFISVPDLYIMETRNDSVMMCLNLYYGKKYNLVETFHGKTEEMNIKLQYFSQWLKKEEDLITSAKSVVNRVII